MPPDKTDTVVIGAGVIGLAVARALALAGREVIVLEAHAGIGQETSSRSSEVIHAGLYYPPGSLKARTCVRGKALLYEYCTAKGVPHRRLGKLIVATDQEQAAALESVRANAAACGVTDLEPRDASDLAGLEPRVRSCTALWSPSTGIIDSHALMLALQADLEGAGGTVALTSKVTGGRVGPGGCELEVCSGADTTIAASRVVNAAGLHAPEVARSLAGMPAGFIPRQYLVRGHYFAHSGRSPFFRLIYPLPEADGLGIHATLDLAGQLRFGPDAEHVEEIDYGFDDDRASRFCEAIRRWYPDLDESRLQPGYVGIRPRLAGPGAEFSDFAVSGPRDHGVPGVVHLYGIDSPGLTACLALAEVVAAMSGQ